MSQQPPIQPKEVQELTPLAEDISAAILEETKNSQSNQSNGFPKEEKYIIIEKVAKQLEQNLQERVKYAKKTFSLTCWWIAVVLVIVILSGINLGNHKLINLTEKIVLVLITTTTINVFGFFLLVMQFLFNKSEMKTLTALYHEDSSIKSLNFKEQSPPDK